MTAGLQVFKQDGTIIIDTTTLVGSALGRISTGITNGSYEDPRIGGNNLFWFAIPGVNMPVQVPEISRSGNSIVWTFESPGSLGNNSLSIVYGVY